VKNLTPIACRFILKKGSLEACDLADLLPVFFWNEKSGVVEFENSQSALDREVFFESGIPVQIASYRKSESLGNFLLAEGHLNDEQYKDLIDLMLDQSLSIHEALAKTTFLHPDELAMAVSLHQQKMLLSLLEERQGQFRFQERPLESHEKPQGNLLAIGPIYAQSLIEKMDADFLKIFLEHSIVLHEDFDCHMQTLGFSSETLELVLGKSYDQLLPEDWSVILTALDFQLLNIVFKGPASYHQVQKLKGQDATAEMARKDIRRSRIILNYWVKTYDFDDAQLLNVEHGAAPKAVKAAYFKAVKNFHPDRFRGKVSEAVMDYCDHLFHRLTQAFENLSRTDHAQSNGPPPKKEDWRLAEAYGLLAGQQAMQKNFRGALLLAEAATRCFNEEGRGPMMHDLASYVLANDESRESLRESLQKKVATFLSKQRQDLFWQAMSACLLVDEGQTQAGVRALESLLGDFPEDAFLLDLLKSAVASFTSPELCVTRSFFLNP